MVIERIETYIDDSIGANVTVRINTETDEMRYEGIASAMLSFAPNMPPRPLQVSFKIDAGSLEDAFNKYQELAKKAVEDEVKKIQDSMLDHRIIDPSKIDMSNINILGK